MRRFIVFVFYLIIMAICFVFGALAMGIIEHFLGSVGLFIVALGVVGWWAWRWSAPPPPPPLDFPIGPS